MVSQPWDLSLGASLCLSLGASLCRGRLPALCNSQPFSNRLLSLEMTLSLVILRALFAPFAMVE